MNKYKKIKIMVEDMNYKECEWCKWEENVKKKFEIKVNDRNIYCFVWLSNIIFKW